MRVTADTREQTRLAILDAARKLFVDKGFEETTTRDLAGVARIATGTLFNYFPSKEALGLELLAGECAGLADDSRNSADDSGVALEEALFALVMRYLRALGPLRPAVGAIVECGLNPFATPNGAAAECLRTTHLEQVRALVSARVRQEPSFLAMHLYWTLFLGVLVFWSRDESVGQEETLALLDQSTRLYVAALRGDGNSKEAQYDA